MIEFFFHHFVWQVFEGKRYVGPEIDVWVREYTLHNFIEVAKKENNDLK